jgi:hypothetical protein
MSAHTEREGVVAIWRQKLREAEEAYISAFTETRQIEGQLSSMPLSDGNLALATALTARVSEQIPEEMAASEAAHQFCCVLTDNRQQEDQSSGKSSPCRIGWPELKRIGPMVACHVAEPMKDTLHDDAQTGPPRWCGCRGYQPARHRRNLRRH